MAKKKRPSLKDFLATGMVDTGEDSAPRKVEAPSEGVTDEAARTAVETGSPQPAVEVAPPQAEARDPEPGEAVPSELRDLLAMLCSEDRSTWERIFAAAEAEVLPLDLVERREDFRTMDRARFTLFKLEAPGAPLFHVRTSVQIREPLTALIKWDETGRASVYRP